MKIWILATLIVFMGINENAHSWGKNGHRIVGHIAESRLNPEAKRKIATILGDESLAEASTWADDVRSDKKFEKYDPWHYVEIPPGSDYGSSPKNPEGDLIMAIRTTIEVLQGKSTVFRPKEALRYLIHFVGDLHQPLHVGNGLDQGGNLCVVKHAARNTNLHVVWDTSLIESRSLGYTEMSEFLNRQGLVTAAKVREWTTGTYLDWAQEAIQIRESIYPPNNSIRSGGKSDLKNFAAETAIVERSYCKKNETDTIPTALIPVLSYDYEYKYKKTLDEQLTKGGVRLSFMLNEIFR